MTQLQQTLREQARFPWQETTVQDIGGAFRYFRRNLGFFAVAAVISALGIGAMTAVLLSARLRRKGWNSQFSPEVAGEMARKEL